MRPTLGPGAPQAQVGISRRRRRNSISVIVPVYGDFEATQACFESLMPEIPRHPKASLIVVDDASRDLRIKSLVQALSKEPHVCLLTNERNLGFAASVNRALKQTGRGDVILLNADTVVPPGFIARLEAVARSDAQIGTVTPLSNNGELTSFPVAFRPNPLESYEIFASSMQRQPVSMPVDRWICRMALGFAFTSHGPASMPSANFRRHFNAVISKMSISACGAVNSVFAMSAPRRFMSATPARVLSSRKSAPLSHATWRR